MDEIMRKSGLMTILLFSFLAAIAQYNSYGPLQPILEHDSLNTANNNFLKRTAYQLHKPADIVLGSAGVLLAATSFLFIDEDTLTLAELSASDKQGIPQFEQYIIYSDPERAHIASTWSNAIAYAGFGIAGSVVLFTSKNKVDIADNIVMYTEGFLLTAGTTELLKRTVDRKRPYVYDPDVLPDKKTDKKALQSFPSAHTSYTAFNCFFAAQLLSAYCIADDNKTLNTVNWSVAATIPLVTGYLRTEAGVHFWTDVAGGYAIGSLFGLLIPHLHENKNMEISFYPLTEPGAKGFGYLINF